MKRWVLLGLLAGLAACKKEEDPPDDKEPQACPGTSESWLPGAHLAQQAVEDDEVGADGLHDVLVTFRPSVSASAMARTEAFASELTRMGAQVQRRFPSLSTVSARMTAGQRAALAQNPDVLKVEPNRVVRAFGLPRLPTQALMGGLVPPNRTGSVGEYTDGLKMVQAPDVWDSNNDGTLDDGKPSGTGIKVCVVDSGWDPEHKELQAAFVAGKDFIDNDDNPADSSIDSTGASVRGGGHGTHTAATIVAQLGGGGNVRPGDDASGVAGVAPTASLLVARVLDVRGNGRTDDVIAAIQWCVSQGAHIASLSLGSGSSAEAERLAFAEAAQRGMLSIAASGNAGNPDPNLTQPVSYPAAYPSVVAVGAVDFAGEWASFSQYGPELALVGPGVNVLSATLTNGAPFAAVDVEGAPLEAAPLEYSAVGTYTDKLVYCGLGDSITACGTGATCDGFVALVDRGGGIYFEEKARNAIRAGAKAIIVGNNEPDEGAGNFTLTNPSSRWKPTASISMADAADLKNKVGQEVTVDVSGADYARQSGTSMATPHVSGVAALVWSARPDLTAAQVREALEKSARPLGPAGKDDKYGWGLVQAPAAIAKANELFPLPPQP